MDGRERRILIISCFGHFLTHFNMLVFPAVVLPLAAYQGQAMMVVLEYSFWMYLLFGLTSLPWGLAADRWTARSLMLLFFLGAGTSSFAAYLWAHSPVGLTLALAGVGLFSGIYHPVGLGMISKGVRRLSVGMGYNGMFGNMGLALAPLLAGVVNWMWGPQTVFLALALMNLAGAALMVFMPIGRLTGEASRDGTRRAGHLQAFLILLVAMMLGGLAYRGATVILPTYFELKSQEIYTVLSNLLKEGLSGNLLATTIASFIYTIGILGQYAGGRLAERYDTRVTYLAFHAMCVLPAFFMAATQGALLIVFAVFYFFFLFGFQPAENTLVARFAPEQLHHSAYGIKFVLTFGVGAFAVKMVAGIENAWGIEFVFTVLGVTSLVIVGTVLLLILKTKPASLSPTEHPG
jgi:MFS family permease